MSALRIGSLCSGYGGLDLAVQSVVGGELAWVADNDPGAAKILAHRYPDVPNLGDITTTDWREVEPVDILGGGYPCQPFSDAGPRKGTDDERHIWPYFAAAIRVLRPRLIVLENVRGHLGRGFNVVLGDLAALGFDAEWVTMPASGVGACHRRQRVFILAWPTADPECGELQRWGIAGVLGSAPAGELGEGDQRERSGDTARDSGAAAAEDPDSAARGEWRLAATGETAGGRPWADAGRPGGTPVAANANGERLRPHGRTAHGDAEVDRPDNAEPDRGRGPVAERGPLWGVADTWHRPGAFGPYEGAVRQHERAFGRRAPAPVGPGRGGKPRLAPQFPEWMMGLPAGWVTDVPGLSRNDQLHAIGNGVMPQQGAAAIRLLLERAPEAMRSLLARTEPAVAA